MLVAPARPPPPPVAWRWASNPGAEGDVFIRSPASGRGEMAGKEGGKGGNVPGDRPLEKKKKV